MRLSLNAPGSCTSEPFGVGCFAAAEQAKGLVVLFQSRSELACTNLETSLCDPWRLRMQYLSLQGDLFDRVPRGLPGSVLSGSGLPSCAASPLAPHFLQPGRLSLSPGRCMWGHFPHLPLRGVGEKAGWLRPRPRQRGRRRPRRGRRDRPGPARVPPALSPLGPEWQSGARTIRIASRRPAPCRPLIGCRPTPGPAPLLEAGQTAPQPRAGSEVNVPE